MPGQMLRSRSGSYSAVMQMDGNFVVLGPHNLVRWASNSAGWTSAFLNLLTNGVLVLMAGSRVLYTVGSANAGGYRLTMENTGYLVLYNAQSRPVWSTASAPRPRLAPAPKPAAPMIDQSFMTHLLRRTTFGINPELVADVNRAGGTSAWLEQQLNPSAIADAACDSVMRRFPMAFIDPPAAYAQMGNGGWTGMQQLVTATLARQIWSKRQLFEVMVDFWSNHLNITTPSSEPWATKMNDDRTVIRANALGRFDNMLVASMKSPAMLLYLSNSQSRGSAPNENYGRELLELHTVGVDAGYDHDSVINVARTLSGYTVWDPWNGGTAANYGTFRYRPEWHYVGPVQALGWYHPNADRNTGPAAVESLGRYLASHAATARRIATKLAIRFVSDNPPTSLIDKLTQVYLSNQTAIIPVLRTLFASAEFAASVGQKYRRPAEDLIATVRVLGITPDLSNTKIDAVQGWMWVLSDLGNAPLGWVPPNGYPDVAPAWTGAGTTLARWNLHLGVTQKWWSGGAVFPDLKTYLLGTGTPSSRGALIDALAARLLPGQTIASAHRQALIAFLGPDGPLRDGDVTWLFPVLVAMVLNTPYWSVR